ncbi:MAG: F-type H+-transporting ATPase subunit a [Thermoleophilaceae bacterium]|jgi:F-type H+-transporting ATPase subunit a|nr:F-type H+-transporting ATPase subunit a [Thermoleophilaceae bacterium]
MEAATAPSEQDEKDEGMGTGKKVLIAVVGVIALAVILNFIFPSQGMNSEYQPQNEFMLTPWIDLKLGGLDLSINKAVFYLFIASALTVFTMVWIAKRMEDKPNRVQTAVEAAYDLTKNNIAGGNMDKGLATKWFPFIGTLFFFIWFSNMIGYLPLPTNTEHPVNILGAKIPSLALYAATANLSVPLVLTLVVWISYHVEGVRAKGFVGYFKSWLPAGVSGAAAVPIFMIEVISQFVRIISLSVRLFANILAGHLLILFMGGGLVVLLGLAAAGVFTGVMAIAFFVFEVGLVATLQAFIFATLTSIYLGGATAAEH